MPTKSQALNYALGIQQKMRVNKAVKHNTENNCIMKGKEMGTPTESAYKALLKHSSARYHNLSPLQSLQLL